MERCIHCRQPLRSDEFGAELFSLYFRPQVRDFLHSLIKAKGEPVHYDRLVAIVRDGKPKAGLQLMAHTINAKIADKGYRIVNEHNFGYRLVKTPYHRPTKAATWTKADVIR